MIKIEKKFEDPKLLQKTAITREVAKILALSTGKIDKY